MTVSSTPLRRLVVAAILLTPIALMAAKPGSLSVSPATLALTVGQSGQLTATNLGGAPTWSSSNETVATVSAGGLVTAHQAGAARVTVKSSGRTAFSDVTVTGTAPPPTDVGLCGEDLTRWHASQIGDCTTSHEHGDAPPAWVTNGAYPPHFNHHGGTPNENVLKHTAFKGYNFIHAGTGTEIYVLAHNDVHPNGQQTRFHSVQVWTLDAQGGLSYWQQWMDFGVGDMTGPQIAPADNCTGVFYRPVIAVNFPECGYLIRENWYANPTHAWGWDVGQNTSPAYYGGPQMGTYSSGLLADSATWLPTGMFNVERRIELAFYRDRFNQSGAPTNVEFYGTQWGQLVSGPNDPICGTPRTFGTRTYTTACLAQFVSSTMPSFDFTGGNAYENTWACPNCKLPN